jgi:hypothetical protein
MLRQDAWRQLILTIGVEMQALYRQLRPLTRHVGLCVTGLVACSAFANEADKLTVDPAPSGAESPGRPCDASRPVTDPSVDADAVSIPLSLNVLDIGTRVAPSNLEVRACLITDPDCERPISDALGADADGVVTIPLALGITGYLEIRGDGITPALFPLPGMLSSGLAGLLERQPLVVIPSGVDSIASPIRSQSEPGAGSVVVTVSDCDGQAAPGVRLELDTAAVPFSIVDGLLVMNQSTTTGSAVAGFINVMPGVAIIRGYRAATGEVFGEDTAPVRPGWDTLVRMLPDGAQP